MNPPNYQKMKDDFTNYLKSRQYATESIKTYINTINLLFKWLEKENIEVEEVSYNDLLLYMKHCSHRGMSQRGIAIYVSVIKHFYNHLIKEESVTTNPALDITVKGVKRKILYHILEPHDLHGLYNGYKAEELHEKRNRVMLGLLVYQGLKSEELARLTVKDVRLREGKIDVLGGKRSNGRMMQLESHQVLDMYDYVLQTRPEILKEMKQPNDVLLVTKTGANYISNFMTDVTKKLRKVNPNVLNAKQIRASVITKWLKIYNLREVQYLSGHRYISSTEWYLENDMEGLQEEVQQYHPLG